MKIAFLIVSISLIVVVSSYDINTYLNNINLVLMDVGRAQVPCSDVKKIVLDNGISDEATISQIPETSYRKCLSGVHNLMTKNQDVIDAVDENTLVTTLKALQQAADGH